eukprot:TRINITY_DN3349_c0_g4_i1.p1 TRINITY_DN3349_c0_g4~~TRINITY_DN3349_c0_g4_i1.p1  ORF type:complete len:388 (+),score=59.81 TRINITY_DN3349_c0_g4_i1:119-1165(+)
MGEQGGKKKPPPWVNGKKFEVEKKLGAGCFGEVYRGKNTETGELVAIKTEDVQSLALQLESEFSLLTMLRNPSAPQGFAECFYFGREGAYHCLVMELLGRSVEDMVQKCGGKFTPKTTLLVAVQVLRRIEFLHSKGVIHRDIKPENFMFGVQDKIHHIYLIDFGLSKRYWDRRHIGLRTKLSLTGTARYASINAHKGYEQSRRDDLEAIGHMLLYFLRGSLPWSGLDAMTKDEKYRKIMEKKETFPLPELCQGFPGAFESYLRYARGLGFTDCPEYGKLQEDFAAVRAKEGNPADHEFQWFDGKSMPPSLVPLDNKLSVRQPDAEKPRGGKWWTGLCFCGRTTGVRES